MRLVTVTLWLLAGAALTGGAYWSFLITPESTAWTLAASALLALTAAFLAGVTISGAIVVWQHGASSSHLRTAIAGAAGIPGAVIAARDLVARRQRDRPRHDLQRPHQRLVHRNPRVGRRVVAVPGDRMVGGVAEVGSRAHAGVVGHRRASWPAGGARWEEPPGCPPRACAACPWSLPPWCSQCWWQCRGFTWTPWRPTDLPATSIELAFIIAKLSATALLMAIGAALIIRQAASKVL